MTVLHPTPSIIQFIDDDSAYLKWLEENPEGFVVNSERNPKPGYLKLHRADCSFVSSPRIANWTTTDYIKTCSRDLDALKQWAVGTTGGMLDPCGSCKPDGLPEKGSNSDTQSPPPPSVKPPAERPSQLSTGKRANVPSTIASGCPELDLVWKTFAQDILNRPHVMIPDTEVDLNWHAFLGHSIDMQGFRAAEFAGIDPLSKSAPDFVPLRKRGVGIKELSELWEVSAIQQHLLGKDLGPLSTSINLLRKEGGETGKSLADAFDAFPFRKAHWTVRALLQNSHTLRPYGFSFRNWLKTNCQELGESEFPPKDFRRVVQSGESLEMALRRRLQNAFFMVGPALAPYMLCDWQLWLWNEGKIPVFANFKLDSFHEEFVKQFGRGVVPTSEQGFAEWWLDKYPTLPPRMVNECIWLGMEHQTV